MDKEPDISLSQMSPDFEFEVLVSQAFQKSIQKEKELITRRQVYACITDLARTRTTWSGSSVKKIDIHILNRALRSARINDKFRLLWEGPVRTKRFAHPILFIHDFCRHDQLDQTIRRCAGVELPEIDINGTDLDPNEPDPKDVSGIQNSVPFAKSINVAALLSPEVIDRILDSDKANILLTENQIDVLKSNRPLLIHGHAGSGKTTILCHRLALSIKDLDKKKDPGRLVFLSYNDKLIKQAEKDTKEILRYLYQSDADLSSVDFLSFRKFLKQFIQDSDAFADSKYIGFSLFKKHYDKYKQGNPIAKRVSAEVAWHGIRSLLKGACIPPEKPPMDKSFYEKLARKRKEFTEETFNDIFQLGQWYQSEIIRGLDLWDDQDLAWTALNWIREQKCPDTSMARYEEIFCDEVQDLTELEFKILVELCKPPAPTSEEGLPILLAGDPLQTINPTGFRWTVVKNEVYQNEGRTVRMHELKENFRSDKRIVDLANYIQLLRSHYMGQTLQEQLAFKDDGDIPQIIALETPDETKLLHDKLKSLPPESAIILWPDDDELINQILDKEKILKDVNRKLDIYSLTESKGLEFRLVILFGFSRHPELTKWKPYIVDQQKLSTNDEIPLLYALNRLYVAVTRAKFFLIIIDSKEGIEKFWSYWPKDKTTSVPRSELKTFLETHPAFIGDMSELKWRAWADILFEQAEKNSDIRFYERAKRAYEKAREIQNIKKVDGRLAELEDRWDEAGTIYFEMFDFQRAGKCFEEGHKWISAVNAYSRLPPTPDIKRRSEICLFRQGQINQSGPAIDRFFDYILSDNKIEINYLLELAEIFEKQSDYDRAASVFRRLVDAYDDKKSAINAGMNLFRQKKYLEALEYFRIGEGLYLREYEICDAMRLKDTRPFDSIKKLHHLGEHKLVVGIADSAAHPITNKLEYDKIVADSRFELSQYLEALTLYNSILATGEIQDNEEKNNIKEKMGDCLARLGRKSDAFNYYHTSRSYIKAIELAKELKVSQKELINLEIEMFRSQGNYTAAIHRAESLNDTNKIYEIRGHMHRSRSQFKEAIDDFISANLWTDALDCLDLANITFTEEHEIIIKVLDSISQSTLFVNNESKRIIMEYVRRIQDDPAWEGFISPEKIGVIYEKCASFSECAQFYMSYIVNIWAKNGWIRIKEKQREFHLTKKEEERERRIKEEIDEKRKMWGI
jgi:tetratricopeptide (TPR) repeat protein